MTAQNTHNFYYHLLVYNLLFLLLLTGDPTNCSTRVYQEKYSVQLKGSNITILLCFGLTSAEPAQSGTDVSDERDINQINK